MLTNPIKSFYWNIREMNSHPEPMSLEIGFKEENKVTSKL